MYVHWQSIRTYRGGQAGDPMSSDVSGARNWKAIPAGRPAGCTHRSICIRPTVRLNLADAADEADVVITKGS